MLVLSRKPGERIEIGIDCILTVVSVEGDKVRIGFDAPPSVQIRREELADKIRNQNYPLTSGPDSA